MSAAAPASAAPNDPIAQMQGKASEYIQAVCQGHRKKRLYTPREVTEAQAECAARECRLPEDETILWLADLGLSGDAGDCFVFGSSGVYWNSAKSCPKRGSIPYTAIHTYSFRQACLHNIDCGQGVKLSLGSGHKQILAALAGLQSVLPHQPPRRSLVGVATLQTLQRAASTYSETDGIDFADLPLVPATQPRCADADSILAGWTWPTATCWTLMEHTAPFELLIKNSEGRPVLKCCDAISACGVEILQVVDLENGQLLGTLQQGMRYVSRIFHIVGAEEIVYATARLSQRIGDPHSTSVTVYAGSPQFNLVTGEEQGSQKVVLTTHGCISGERFEVRAPMRGRVAHKATASNAKVMRKLQSMYRGTEADGFKLKVEPEVDVALVMFAVITVAYGSVP